jgi:hypothetical protein
MLLVLDVLLIVFYYSLLRVFSLYLSLYSIYVTMSISIGLYPNLDLWNANKLHYITVLYFIQEYKQSVNKKLLHKIVRNHASPSGCVF